LQTSEKWQTTQKRFLPFLNMNEKTRIDAFREMQKTRKWKWSTTHGYWIALTSALTKINDTKQMKIEITKLSRNTEKYFLKKKKQEKVAFPMAATPEQVAAAAHILPPGHPLRLILLLSFHMAQRCADIIRLQVAEICVMGTLTRFKFMEGKVVPSIGPYSIHMETHHPVTQELLAFVNTRNINKKKYLFLNQNTEDTTDATSTKQRTLLGVQIKDLLRKINTNLEQRSLRRGALQHMAMTGMTIRQLLYYSKHRSEEMLMRYLDWGTFNLEMATQAVVNARTLVVTS